MRKTNGSGRTQQRRSSGPTQQQTYARAAHATPLDEPLPKGARMVDPTARIDIAVQRMLELMLTSQPDIRIQAAYSMYQREINKTIAQVAGPQTQVGQIAKGAVSTILFINERLEELQRHQAGQCNTNANGNGSDAA